MKQINIAGKRRILTAEEESKWFPPVPLDQLAAAKVAEIDAKTHALKLDGFVWNGDEYDLDMDSITNWHGLAFADAVLGAVTFPQEVTTRAGEFRVIKNNGELKAFFLSGFATIKAVEDSGRELKKAVKAAVDKDKLEAIKDER